MPDPSGRELLRELRETLDSVIERERRLQREVTGRLVAPFDAVFDLLEQSAATLREQGEALAAAGRALEETAGLVRTQAELFERTLATLREPAELAKSAAGLERRPRQSS